MLGGKGAVDETILWWSEWDSSLITPSPGTSRGVTRMSVVKRERLMDFPGRAQFRTPLLPVPDPHAFGGPTPGSSLSGPRSIQTP